MPLRLGRRNASPSGWIVMGSLNTMLGMNAFDAAVYLCLFVAVVMGFIAGLLRSLATIFGYVAGMGIAVAAAPYLTPLVSTQFKLLAGQGDRKSTRLNSSH